MPTGLDIVNCRACPLLPHCCNGSFEGPWRKLMTSNEAMTYGPMYVKPVPNNPGMWQHEHVGSCPHRNVRTGKCAIHTQGKPRWCQTFPFAWDRQGNLRVQPTCVPWVQWDNLPAHLLWLKQLAAAHPLYNQQLLDMGDALAADQ